MNWIVYKHISPSNKVYIGITHLLPSQRWCRGNGYKNNPMFYNAILKYEMVKGEIREFSSQREVAKFLNISEWKVSISIKEHRFVKEAGGYLETKLK